MASIQDFFRGGIDSNPIAHAANADTTDLADTTIQINDQADSTRMFYLWRGTEEDYDTIREVSNPDSPLFDMADTNYDENFLTTLYLTTIA